MIDVHDFSLKQMELTEEFAKYVVDHPELEAQIPDNAYLYFEVNGESEFNRYSRELAERRRAEGQPVAVVRIAGLAKAQRSRLLKPQIEIPGATQAGRSKRQVAPRRKAMGRA